jgi:hypothetical protein
MGRVIQTKGSLKINNPPKEGFGGIGLPLVLIEAGKVVEGLERLFCVLAKRGLADAKGSLIERQRIGKSALLVDRTGQVVQSSGDRRMLSSVSPRLAIECRRRFEGAVLWR